MSLFNVINIAASSLSAQSVRMNITASNMANADSISSSIDETYRAREPIFKALLDEQGFSDEGVYRGVQVEAVVESQTPLRKLYQPGHPKADKEGYIFMPNVNVIEEMANMISASRAYQNNVEVMNASKQMLLRTLAIGQ